MRPLNRVIYYGIVLFNDLTHISKEFVMELSQEIRDTVCVLSLTYLEKKYPHKFSCLTFVRDVYKEIGIEIPPLWGYATPPRIFNIKQKDLEVWDHGYIVFLKRNEYAGERVWTHVGITLPDHKLIHYSEYFCETVSMTPQKDIFKFYHYVPSNM